MSNIHGKDHGMVVLFERDELAIRRIILVISLNARMQETILQTQLL